MDHLLLVVLLLPVPAVVATQVDEKEQGRLCGSFCLGSVEHFLLVVLVLPVLAVLADHGGEELEEDRLVAEDEEFQSRIFHYINFCLLFFNLKCTTSYFSLGYLKRKFK